MAGYPFFTLNPPSSSQFILSLGVEKLERAVVVGFRHVDLGGAVQIAVGRQDRIHERLHGGDAVPLQHGHEHLGVDDRAGVKQFHTGNLATDGHRSNTD